MRGVSYPEGGDRRLRSSPSQACLGTGSDARPRDLVSAAQHESILARSHEGVLQYCDAVVSLSHLLHNRWYVIAGLRRGDECEGILGKVSYGWYNIAVQRAVEELQYVCVEMSVYWLSEQMARYYLD